jgi:hypothetical protein
MGSIRFLVSAFLTFFLSVVVAWSQDYDLEGRDYLGISNLVPAPTATTGSSDFIGFVVEQTRELTDWDLKQVRCLARAMYYESKSEPVEGQLAVAHVIFNRMRSEKYGDSVCDIVNQRTGRVCQFSFLCSKQAKVNGEVYNNIEALAEKFYTNYESFADMTRGALYFHADYVRTAWQGVQRTIKIGRHIFYRPKERARKK